jgi:integrase
MEPRALLDDWLATSALRPSTRAAYHREVTSWLTWCANQYPPIDPYTIGPQDVAAWSEALYLKAYLAGRAFDGPDALAQLAADHPDVAKSHDRRITALTQYYIAALQRHIIWAAPDLTALRSGLDRDVDDPKRLTPRERAVFLATVGAWGPHRARHHLRDQLIAYLLLEGLRPSQVVRVDMRHLYEQDDYTYQVRAPDDHENVGTQFVLDPLTGAALKAYLPVRPRPEEGVHELILGQGGRPVQSRYPNLLIRNIAATHPLLADRQPPITADAVAHTGLWDTPGQGD